jgi:hypothetical protein
MHAASEMLPDHGSILNAGAAGAEYEKAVNFPMVFDGVSGIRRKRCSGRRRSCFFK